jgi:hypothetical protein
MDEPADACGHRQAEHLLGQQHIRRKKGRHRITVPFF